MRIIHGEQRAPRLPAPGANPPGAAPARPPVRPPSPRGWRWGRLPTGRRSRFRLAGLALTLLLAAGWGAACSEPSTTGAGAYHWQFLGYYVFDRELVDSGAVTSGPWRELAGSQVVNDESYSVRRTLRGRIQSSVTYSASFEEFAGASSEKESVKISISTTIPPHAMAAIETRLRSRTDFYRFDVGCRWLNTVTGAQSRTVHAEGVDGRIRHAWSDDRVAIVSLD